MTQALTEALEPLFGAQLLPILVYDPESRAVVFVNEAAGRHYGVTTESLESLSIDDVATGAVSPVDALDQNDGASPLLENSTSSEVVVAGKTYRVVAAAPGANTMATATVAERQQRFQRQQQSLTELARDPHIADGHFPESLDVVLQSAAEALEVRRVGFWRLTQSPPGLCCERLYDRKHDRVSGGAFLDGEQCPIYLKAVADSRVVDASDALRDPRLTELSEYLRANHISSLLDAPVRLHGEMIGVLCHEHVGKPRYWQEDEIRFAGEIADQLVQGLLNGERRRYQRLLHGLTSLVGPETGDAFCRALVTHVAELLGAARVFIAYLDSHDRDRAHTLAVADASGLKDNIEIDLRDPLCAATLRDGSHVISRDLAHRYPNQPWGSAGDGACFIGFRLADRDGTVVGLMAAIGREPIAEDEDSVALLRIFADRAAAQLAQLHREPHLSRAAAVLSNTSEGVAVADTEGRILEANPALAELTGYSPEELKGHSLSDIIMEPSMDDIQVAVDREHRWQGEVTATSQQRGRFPAWLTMTHLPSDDTGIGRPQRVALISDITSIRESQAELEYLAHHDPLTGLFNRNMFHERLDHALAYDDRDNHKLALLFLDIDGFKDINDSLGHSQGDDLLKSVAARLQAATRQQDVFARIGGDEFIVLLDDLTNERQAAQTATRLLEAFHEPYRVADRHVFMTASIGISVYPRDGTSVESLIQSADAAMYDAKGAGKNTFHFFMPALTEQAFERVTLGTALRQALDNGEFFLCYQSQIALADGRITGCEALIRWQRPDGAIVPPGDFIPAAERSGLIVAIGQWVLEAACRQAREWLDQGIDCGRIAVNVATAQISQPDFAEDLLEILERTELPAEYLSIEITESLFLEPHDYVARTLKVIRDAGVEIAIDDFGTGYSSLAYLKRLPIDAVKLDKSFTSDIPDDPEGISIVQAIIGLAGNLGLSVIAEGIEGLDQELFLATLRCERAQGFLHSRPMMPEDYTRLMLSGQNDGPEAADR